MGSKWVKGGLNWVKWTKTGLNGLRWVRIGSKRVIMEQNGLKWV